MSSLYSRWRIVNADTAPLDRFTNRILLVGSSNPGAPRRPSQIRPSVPHPSVRLIEKIDAVRHPLGIVGDCHLAPVLATIDSLDDVPARFTLRRLIADDGPVSTEALGKASFQLLSPTRSLSNTVRQVFPASVVFRTRA
jgi:hypothetical protein